MHVQRYLSEKIDVTISFYFIFLITLDMKNLPSSGPLIFLKFSLSKDFSSIFYHYRLHFMHALQHGNLYHLVNLSNVGLQI